MDGVPHSKSWRISLLLLSSQESSVQLSNYFIQFGLLYWYLLPLSSILNDDIHLNVIIIYLLLWYLIRSFMILHSIMSQRWNNFPLFSLGEITGNSFTPVTSIILIPFTWNKFHDLTLGWTLKLSVSCDKVWTILIY